MSSRATLPVLLLLFAGCTAETRSTPAPGQESAAAKPGPQASAQTQKEEAAIGSWGFDLSGMDTSVDPGDDFFRYASGRWSERTSIPADKSVWGMFEMLREQAEADVNAIVRQLAESRATLTPARRQIVDEYSAFFDQAAIDARGLAPAQPGLQAIAAAKTHEDIARLMGRADLALQSPIAAGVMLDQKNPDRYVVAVTHAGLGLPDREYYLKDEPKFTDIRAKYVAHIDRLLALAGRPDATGSGAKILKLETAIAERHWPRAKRRERDLTYNPHTPQELAKLAPEYPWSASFEAARLSDQALVIVREQDAIQKLAQLFRDTPVADWRTYLTYHYLREHAPVLPHALDDEVFDFYGRTLDGQPQQRARWKRAVAATNAALGEAVGQIYVEQHFPPAARAKMQVLVENLRKAYAARIEGLKWMTPETRKAAGEKLAAFRAKIAYPDKWRDYSSLVVRADDAFGNYERADVFEWRRDVERLHKPSDRDEWRMTPQTVNAYYNAAFNEIVFPAAILQAPFFDPDADAAVNYGGIGGVIGHEMGHGFDDQGSKSDGRGILRTWWNSADDAAFRKLVDRLDAQYSSFVALPGLNVNGRLTLGENIGDLGGLSVSLEAYRLSLGGRPAPVIDNFTGEQRFFLGWAQVWRGMLRDERMRSQVMTNPHSPPQFRVNGVVRNMDSWYAAFGVEPGRALYVPPGERVRIW